MNAKKFVLAGLLFGIASSSSAAIIYQESFEGGALQPQTTLTGDGSSGDAAFFSILPSGTLDLLNTPTGADGASAGVISTLVLAARVGLLRSA